MFGTNQLTESWFARRAGRGPASRQRHQRLRRTLTVEPLEGRALLSTFTVNSLGDTGTGTLRWAITQANQTPGNNTINFSVTGTITLNSALPDLSDTTGLTDIKGPGAAKLTVARSSAAGTPDFGIFTVDSGADVKLVGLTITGGLASNGGGIDNAGTLTLINSTVSSNSVSAGSLYGGGGIYSTGTLTVTNSTFASNSAFGAGGGILSYGLLTVTNSTFATNSAELGGGIFSGAGIFGHRGTETVTNCTFVFNSAERTPEGAAGVGGGIYNADGTLTVTSSTFAFNSADHGGGIFNNGTLTVTNSTFAFNSANYDGGGIANEGMPAATLTVTNSTIVFNSANYGGGIYNTYGTLTVSGSTIIGNFASDDGGGIFNIGSLIDGGGNTITGNRPNDVS